MTMMDNLYGPLPCKWIETIDGKIPVAWYVWYHGTAASGGYWIIMEAMS